MRYSLIRKTSELSSFYKVYFKIKSAPRGALFFGTMECLLVLINELLRL